MATATSSEKSFTLSNGPLNLDVTTSLETSFTVDNFVERRHEVMTKPNAEGQLRILVTNTFPLHSVDGHSYCVQLGVHLSNDVRINLVLVIRRETRDSLISFVLNFRGVSLFVS